MVDNFQVRQFKIKIGALWSTRAWLWCQHRFVNIFRQTLLKSVGTIEWLMSCRKKKIIKHFYASTMQRRISDSQNSNLSPTLTAILQRIQQLSGTDGKRSNHLSDTWKNGLVPGIEGQHTTCYSGQKELHYAIVHNMASSKGQGD